MHRLLKRQLKRLFGDDENLSSDINNLIQLINESYHQFQDDYNQLERTLELSSKESFKELNDLKWAVNNAVIVTTTDINGKIIYANQNFSNVSGYSANDIIGKTHRIINSSYHKTDFYTQLWTDILAGKIWQGEIKNKNKDGNYFWLDTVIIPFLNNAGLPFQFMSISYDITERKAFEEEITKLALVAENTHNAIIVTDKLGFTTWINDGFTRITEYTQEEAIGKKPSEILQGIKTDKKTIADISQSLKSLSEYNGEIYNYSKSGKGFWLSLAITPMYDNNQNHIGFIAIEADITERKLVETRLIENEKLLQAINFASTELLTNDNFSEAIEKILKNLVGNISIDKINIFQNEFDNHNNPVFSHRYSFDATKNNYFSFAAKHQKLSYNELGYNRWFSHFSKGKTIAGLVKDFPKEEQDQLVPQHVVSILLVPILVSGQFWGFIGFDVLNDEKLWSNTEIALLQNFANTLGATFERNESESRLKESEEKFRLLIESASDIFYYSDYRGNFTYVNEVSTTITGYSNEELLKMNYLDLVRDDYKKEVTKVYLTKSSNRNAVIYHEFPIITKSKALKWVGQNVQAIVKDNKHIGYQAIARDITERKEAQEKIEQSENRFRSLVQNATDITTVLSTEGNIIYESPSFFRMFGYTEDETINHNIFTFIHPEDVDKVVNEFAHGIEKGGVSDLIEFRFKHKNGHYLSIESIGNNLTQNAAISGIVVNSRDITERKKAQQEIKDLKDFYEKILNKIPSDIVVFDDKHRYLFVNENAINDKEKREWVINHDDFEYCEHFGRDRKLAEKRREIFNTALTSKQIYEYEESFIKPDGDSKWMLRRMYPIIDDNNEVSNVIGFGIDITERKIAEEKLKESEERLSLATNAGNLGIWDWNLKDNSLIWGKSMYAIYDIDPDKFTGDYDAFEKTLHPDDKQKVNDEINNSIKNSDGYNGEFRIINSKQEIRYIAAHSKLFKDNDDDPSRLVGVNFDITESKLAEQKILKYQQDLEEAQHTAKVGGWEIDVSKQTVKWTKEMYHIYEFDKPTAITMNEAFMFYNEETRVLFLEKFKNVVDKKESFELEGKIITQKGNVVDVRTKGIPEKRDGKLIVSGILQDITSQKEIERKLLEYNNELEKKNKELDQFAYIVSHDLKAPLRGINNLSMWIEEDLEGKFEGDVKTNFDLLRTRVGRMEALINGILEYSRAGRMKPNPVDIDLNNLVKEIIDSIGAPAQYKINVQKDLPIIFNERIAIEQVLTNYISNAVKYNNNSNPEVDISYRLDANMHEFCVTDNGNGIAPEFHEKVFQIFQTLQSRDSFESTGVGLAIVKKIIEDKGGRVWLDSDIGRGAKFYFSLPVNM